MHGVRSNFRKQMDNDVVKEEYCRERNIRLIRIPYFEKNLDRTRMLQILRDAIGGRDE
jgi:hypothetical protein